jgi:hypothetical protein
LVWAPGYSYLHEIKANISFFSVTTMVLRARESHHSELPRERSEQTIDGHIWHVLRASKDGQRTISLADRSLSFRAGSEQVRHTRVHLSLHFVSFHLTPAGPPSVRCGCKKGTVPQCRCLHGPWRHPCPPLI